MSQLRPVGLYGLSFLLASLTSAYPSPDPAPAAKAGFELNLPEPTTAPAKPKNHEFLARDYYTSDSNVSPTSDAYATSSASDTIIAVTTSSSTVPGSVCGYIDGYWDDYYSMVYCPGGNECVFHTSDSGYPGMVGCCSGNDPNNCAYETTCYDAVEIVNSPTLTEDIFAIYCTATGNAACQTMVYPDLDVTGYGCASSAEEVSIYTSATWDPPATEYTMWESYPTVVIISASIVDDAWIDIYASGTAATASTNVGGQAITSTPSTTPHASATPGGSSSKSSKSSSSNTGAIAGGVVGGVVGAAGIGAAAFMWWLLQKKRKQNNAAGATEASEPALGGAGGGMATRDHPTSVLGAPQEVEGSVSTGMLSPPQEMEGTTYQHYAEVDGYSAGQKFPSAVADSRDMKPQEMDSKNFVAELPAHQDENRPLSSDTSRPATPEGRRS